MNLGYVIIKGSIVAEPSYVEMYAGHTHKGIGKHNPECIWTYHLASFRNSVVIYDTEAEAISVARMISKEGTPCDVMPLIAGKPRGTLT